MNEKQGVERVGGVALLDDAAEYPSEVLRSTIDAVVLLMQAGLAACISFVGVMGGHGPHSYLFAGLEAAQSQSTRLLIVSTELRIAGLVCLAAFAFISSYWLLFVKWGGETPGQWICTACSRDPAPPLHPSSGLMLAALVLHQLFAQALWLVIFTN